MKHRLLARVLAVVMAVSMLVIAPEPVKVEAAISQHHFYPYQGYYINQYYGDPKTTFSMQGTAYEYGFTHTSWDDTTACFDLNGDISSVSMVIGHLDGQETEDGTLEVYLDDVYSTTYSRNLTAGMAANSLVINTSGKQKLVLVIKSHYGDYGIANIVQNSVHHYVPKVTKVATSKENGIRKFTCDECGASYTEVIPAHTYCEPYLFPYQIYYMNKFNEEEGSSTNYTVMGTTYYKGLTHTSWDDSTADYSLNAKYNSLSFTVGHLDYGETADGTLIYKVDGVELDSIPLKWDMTDLTITVPNLSSARQFQIIIQSHYGDYAIFNMEGDLKDKSHKAHSYIEEELLAAEFGVTGVMKHTCTECGAFYTTEIPALKRSLKDENVSVELSKTTYTYNGSARKPRATVKYTVDGTENVLVKNTDYTVSYSNNKNAGKATVIIKGKGNYKDTKKVKFTIKKAKQSPTIKGKTVSVSYKKLKKANQKISKAKAFTVKETLGKVTFKKTSGNSKISVSKAGKITVKKGLKKGTYKVKVKVTSAATTNYKAYSKTVTVTIKVK